MNRVIVAISLVLFSESLYAGWVQEANTAYIGTWHLNQQTLERKRAALFVQFIPKDDCVAEIGVTLFKAGQNGIGKYISYSKITDNILFDIDGKVVSFNEAIFVKYTNALETSFRDSNLLINIKRGNRLLFVFRDLAPIYFPLSGSESAIDNALNTCRRIRE
jgi:hypothetical protein